MSVRTRLLSVLGCLIVLSVILISDTPQTISNTPTSDATQPQAARPPSVYEINGETDWDALFGEYTWFTGTGTMEDPYVITRNFAQTDLHYAVFEILNSSTVNVVFRNCNFTYSGSTWSSIIYMSAAIATTRISNITFDGCSFKYPWYDEDYAYVYIFGQCSDITFTNCKFSTESILLLSQWNVYGIVCDKISTYEPIDIQITHCHFEKLWVPIGLDDCSNIAIDACDFSEFQYGMYLYTVDAIHITRNTFNGAYYTHDTGIYETTHGENLLINDNQFIEIEVAVSVGAILTLVDSTIANNIMVNGSAGIDINYAEDCTITNNTIMDNDGIGLALYGRNNKITDNTLIANAYFGAYVDGERNYIFHNNISLNGDGDADFSGLAVYNEGAPNVVWFNYFSENYVDEDTAQVYQDPLDIWYNANLKIGNYYSDYADLYPDGVNVNGIWSIPYGYDQYPIADWMAIDEYYQSVVDPTLGQQFMQWLEDNAIMLGIVGGVAMIGIVVNVMNKRKSTTLLCAIKPDLPICNTPLKK